MRLRNSLSAVMLAIAFMISGAVLTAETQDEKEAKEAAAEEDAFNKAGEVEQMAAQKSMTGKFVLTPPTDDDPNPKVVGTFSLGVGQSYLVKVEHQVVLKKLAGYDNKKVTVRGKIRNQGKYLIVSEIMSGREAPPAERSKRGGL